MKQEERNQYIIEQYQNDEEMMILIFAQWCVNNDINARELYQIAYPEQVENSALLEALDKTVTKEESEDIPHEIVQHVLQLFGNDDLAFIVQEKVDAMARKRK